MRTKLPRSSTAGLPPNHPPVTDVAAFSARKSAAYRERFQRYVSSGLHSARMTTPLTSPPTGGNRVRIEPLCIGRPGAFAAIVAMVTSALLAGCGNPTRRVAEAAPAAVATAPAADDKSTTTIQCPPRGPFGNGPTYYSQFYEDYILGYVFKDHEHGFYVDVGANDPDDSSVTKYLLFGRLARHQHRADPRTDREAEQVEARGHEQRGGDLGQARRAAVLQGGR